MEDNSIPGISGEDETIMELQGRLGDLDDYLESMSEEVFELTIAMSAGLMRDPRPGEVSLKATWTRKFLEEMNMTAESSVLRFSDRTEADKFRELWADSYTSVIEV